MSEPAAAREEPPIAIDELAPAATMRAEPSTVATAPVPEVPGAAISEPAPGAAVAGAHVEPTAARPRTERAPAASALPSGERARTRREETAERRYQRQERARIRREAASTRASSTAVVAHAEPMTVAAREATEGAHGTGAVGRRMQHGTVKWFSAAKGYGFIHANDGTQVFVHHSAISSEGFRTLAEGQAVSYDEVASPKGLAAVNVLPMELGSEGARP